MRGSIPIKKASEIEKMREACQIAAQVLDRLVKSLEVGMSTYDIDQLAKEFIKELGAESACYLYQVGPRRFPGYICISVNEEVVHGIGKKEKILHEGDCVTLDVVVRYNGFIGDNARTVILPPESPELDLLVKTTEGALYEGIAQAVAGNRVGDISNAIEKYIRKRDLSIVKEFVGHGVGRQMHEEPQIPNFGPARSGPKLLPGMTLAIEPMVNLGTAQVEILSDGWTAVTKDRKSAAHFEHTVLVTEEKPEILTFLKK